MNTKTRNRLIELRRNTVLEGISKGKTQSQIAKDNGVSESLIANDVKYLRQQAKENIAHYIDSELPLEYHKALAGLNVIIRDSFNIADNNHSDNRDRLQSLALAKEAYNMKIDMLSSATVLEKALSFIKSYDDSSNNKNKNKQSELSSEVDTNKVIEDNNSSGNKEQEANTGDEYSS